MRPDGRYTLIRPVFFVGFMGAGKTSVARRLARNLGLSSVDADTLLSRRLGVAAGEYIRQYGESAFRVEEARLLGELATWDPAFISCGGGVIATPANVELLRAQMVVYLEVSADEARRRIADVSSRPLFGNIVQARALAAARAPLYEQVASVRVQTVGKPVPVLAREVQDILEREGVLCQQPKSS